MNQQQGNNNNNNNNNNASFSSMTMATSNLQMMQRQTSSRSSFTEAVPLSLSYMAHLAIPLQDGVLDGLCEAIQHTMVMCVHTAQRRYMAATSASGATAASLISLRDFVVSEWNTTARPTSRRLPPQLLRLGFQHEYIQEAWISFGHEQQQQQESTNNNNENTESSMENDDDDDDWIQHSNVYARVVLQFASQELLTMEELTNTAPSDNDEYDDDDDDGPPPTVLFQASVEYKSLPPSGKREALEAEELSMLSLGASVDDAVKYGALAALHDVHAKYVLEIYSVRGKKYKFDCMSATLSNGLVPRLEALEQQQLQQQQPPPPFCKSLCVTVTDHVLLERSNVHTTRLVFTLADGTLKNKQQQALLINNRNNNSSSSEVDFSFLPPMHSYAQRLEHDFISWLQPTLVVGMPCRQALLLDPELAGHIFCQGRCRTIWSPDTKTIGTHVGALFGMDLHGIPIWHNRIVDYNVLKQEYATLWQELLIDARLARYRLAHRLLWRLMYGPRVEQDEAYYDNDLGEYGYQGGYDDDEEDDEDVDNDLPREPVADPSVKQDCLESQVMASAHYDPVGICAKALATRFAVEFGKMTFPCVAQDVMAVKQQLGHYTPKIVPQRLLNVLRRGGYFDVERTTHEIWFATTQDDDDDDEKAPKRGVRPSQTTKETQCIEMACELLATSCNLKILPNHVLWVHILDDANPHLHNNLCRYHEALNQFYVNDVLLLDSADDDKKRAFWVAHAMAQAYSFKDGTIVQTLIKAHI